MSDSNRVQISYIKEVTAGVTPAGNLTPVPMTGESFKAGVESTESQIIRADGNVPDVIRTDLVPQGGFNSEVGFGFFDELIEAAFRNTLEAAVSVAAITIAYVTGSPDSITDSGSGLGAIEVNDIINVQGFADANDNGLFMVITAAAGTIDVVPLDSSVTTANETAGASVTIKTQRVRNGTEDHYFSVEKAWLDKAGMFHAFRGMMVDTLQLTIAAKAVLTSAFAFLGKGHTTEVATIGSGYDATPSADSMNAVNHFKGTLLRHNDAGDPATPTACITRVELNIANAIRRDVGLNCENMGKGKFMFTLSWDAFFNDMVVYDEYVADGFTTLAVGILDNTNQGYGMVIPKIRYTDADILAGGGDQPVLARFTGQGVLQTVGADDYTAAMFLLA